jgi:hypothetical protein
MATEMKMKLLLENWQKHINEDTRQPVEESSLWGQKLSSDKRYFISSKPFTGFRSIKQGVYHPWANIEGLGDNYSDEDKAMPDNYKPRGLWYACGDAWIDWLRLNSRWDLAYANYLYEIQINESVLKITSKSDFIKFSKIYDIKRELYTDVTNWRKVQQDGYTGIEVCPYDKQWRWDWDKEEEKIIGGMWFNTWDAASGCIWDTSGVQNIILVKERFEGVNIFSPSFSEDMAYIEKINPGEAEEYRRDVINLLHGPLDEDEYYEYLEALYEQDLGKQPSGYMFYGAGGPNPGHGESSGFYNTETDSWQNFTDEDTFTRYFITLDGSLIIDKRSILDQGILQRAKEKGVIIF